MKKRISKLQAELKEKELDALLINTPENRRYMTGFTGTAGTVLVSQEEAILITDFRYTQQAKKQAPDYRVVEFKGSKLDKINELLKGLKIDTLGFEATYENYNTYLNYKEKLDVSLKATENIVKKIRMIKNSDEIEKIKKAVEITDDAFTMIREFLRIGVIERDVALELEFFMKKAGATDNAFDFIVASGERSALPHGVASDKKITAGDFVTMDFGCVYDGYHSDMTRTVVVGEEATTKQKEIYEIVLKAQLEAIKGIKAGIKGSEVDKIARDIIAQAGYEDYFGHGLGHCVGLEIHEGPRLSPKDDTVLEAGMVVTVEPGIYLPNWGGVRIEDIVVVTEDGCEILTESSKELLIIDN
ncbi:M24 family metallopeptidase [Orenia marismortui]|uniref:Xaa-Pro aminopeptidase n=1 Tax=Orenia marismortui TaxID=46469 RepID=A0A4R8GTG4_9FIRM|nr:Xaa-Pro peptidase family protein [Orenia marismortui]TDX45413.1 Xaa-Pro aminopeptidase [Orenia marismortui]